MIPKTLIAVAGSPVFFLLVVAAVISCSNSNDIKALGRNARRHGGLGVGSWPIGDRRRFARSAFSCRTKSSWSSTADNGLDNFAVIIDAGSSGSRVRVYNWTFGSREEQQSQSDNLPRLALDAEKVVHVFSAKIEPGLSAHAADLNRVANDVRQLLRNASQHVPEKLRRSTPVYIMATAGMRLLLEDKMNEIFRYIDTQMQDDEFNPFQYRSIHHTRILSGEEEGVFAWIAVNYVTGALTSLGGKIETVGVLEMGGQSTQIAFIPSGNVMASKFPVHIGGCRYPLYVHSYLNYGQSAIDNRVKKYLIESAGDSADIKNPCAQPGYSINDKDYKRTFVGVGNATECHRILESLVRKADEAQCHQKPCAIGPSYQPTIPQNMTFYAVGSFVHAPKAIGALQPDGMFTPSFAFERAKTYCDANYNDLVDEIKRKNETFRLKYVPATCLRALYYAVLFSRGYNFDVNTKQILAVETINNQPLDWTLGAILYENELDFIHSCRHQHRSSLPMPGAVQFDSSNAAHTIVTNQWAWLVLVAMATVRALIYPIPVVFAR